MHRGSPRFYQEASGGKLNIKIMKITSLERDAIHHVITILCTSSSAVDKGWEQLEKMPAWELTYVKSKKKVI